MSKLKHFFFSKKCIALFNIKNIIFYILIIFFSLLNRIVIYESFISIHVCHVT